MIRIKLTAVMIRIKLTAVMIRIKQTFKQTSVIFRERYYCK